MCVGTPTESTMDNIFEHYKKTGYLHHAYVIEGLHEDVVRVLVPAIERHLGISAKGNPDFSITRHESFSIDEARALKDVEKRSAWGGGKKIYIIGAITFPLEAQNALLKTLEEPTAGTHFFIILPRAEILLPTLRSRVLVVSADENATDEEAKDLATKFLEANLENRFVLIKKLIEKKDRDLFRRMLNHIEKNIYARTKGKRDSESGKVFSEIYQAKMYLATRGASPKMLLEHVAMVV